MYFAHLPSLAHMVTASSGQLAERSLLTRIDRKFVTTTSVANDFLRRLGDDYRVVLAAGSPWAQYETSYYDTPELSSFNEHLRGRRPRYKVRVRHHVDRQRSFLEVKRKVSSERTEKVRLALPYGTAELSEQELAFLARSCPYAPETLRPSVWTNFRRATLVGIQSNERITVDLDLRFERNGLSKTHPALAIVELKQARLGRTTEASLLLRELRVREASMSKYCAGVADVHELALARFRNLAQKRGGRLDVGRSDFCAAPPQVTAPLQATDAVTFTPPLKLVPPHS